MAIIKENQPAGWTPGQAGHPTTTTAPPAYSGPGTAVLAPTPAYPVAKHPQVAATPGTAPATQPGCCRIIFWISAGLSWVVWIFSIASAGDQNWVVLGDFGTGIEQDNFDGCNEDNANDSACDAYEAFAATHIISTIMISVATFVYTAAFFRPFEAQHGSTKVLGLVGGIISALGAFFQLLAVIFADEWLDEVNEEWQGTYEFESGDTFIVGVVTLVIGIIQAILVLLSFSSAGDGPLLPIVRRQVIPNELKIPANRSQNQAGIEQGVQIVPTIPQGVHIKSSLQQGATLTHPAQNYGAGMPPPPAYDSN